jgi:hypothetical protein
MSRSRVIVTLCALLVAAGAAWAAFRVRIPEDGEPFAYTSPAGPGFEPGVIHDGEWAAIPFYRSPECVPLDFNLFDWFDPNAADCPLLVDGFAVFNGEDFPAVTQLSGDEVPIWFFNWSELQGVMADGELYIGELEGLDSLRIGTATKYEEQLHFGGPHRVPHTAISAKGTLEDGSSFHMVVARENAGIEYEQVRIAFK